MINLLQEKNHFFSESLYVHLKSVKITLLFSVLALFNFIFTPLIFADGKTNVLSFDYFSQTDGLPNNQIQCIFQDRNGWIWLGTSQGLSRFENEPGTSRTASADATINTRVRGGGSITQDKVSRLENSGNSCS